MHGRAAIFQIHPHAYSALTHESLTFSTSKPLNVLCAGHSPSYWNSAVRAVLSWSLHVRCGTGLCRHSYTEGHPRYGETRSRERWAVPGTGGCCFPEGCQEGTWIRGSEWVSDVDTRGEDCRKGSCRCRGAAVERCSTYLSNTEKAVWLKQGEQGEDGGTCDQRS